LLDLSNATENRVKDKERNHRDGIKVKLKVALIPVLFKLAYPPVDDEIYKEIFEQTENFKKNVGRLPRPEKSYPRTFFPDDSTPSFVSRKHPP